MSKVKTVQSSEVNLNLVVTPFLDMAFQILGFFVMTYHPSALEGHIDGRLLPPDKQLFGGGTGAATKDIDLPPANEDPIVEDHTKVVIRAVRDNQTEGKRQPGEPSQILLQQPQDPSPLIFADNDVEFPDALQKLKAQLQTMLNEEGGDKRKIRLLGDGNLKYLYIMEVYDLCRMMQSEKNGKKLRFADVSFVGPNPQ